MHIENELICNRNQLDRAQLALGIFDRESRRWIVRLRARRRATNKRSPKPLISQGVHCAEQDQQEFEQVSTRHLKSLLEFKDDLDNAAKQALAKRQSYNRIVALVLYWEEADGLEHLRKKADKLSTKFSETFRFETKTMAIPSDDDAREDFKLDIMTEVRKVGKDSHALLIMYYGGHADNKDNKLVWLKENTPTSKSIKWSAWQSFLLESTVCDKLFLADCCHAGDIIERMAWKGACELLGASSGALQASAKHDSSFTKALLKILDESTIWDIRDIYASFTDSAKRRATYGLTVDPFFWDYSNGLHAPLCLRPAESKQSLTPAQADVEKTNTISDARILIKVIFHGEASIVMEEWQRFLSRLPKAVAGFAFDACRDRSLAEQFLHRHMGTSSVAVGRHTTHGERLRVLRHCPERVVSLFVRWHLDECLL